MFFFLLMAMFIILLFMTGLKIIENIFSGQEYYIILQIFLVGFAINSVIILFLKMVFKDYKFKKGSKGETGTIGEKGLKGIADNCSECNMIKNTLGDEKIINDKKKLRVEIPVIHYDIKGEPIN